MASPPTVDFDALLAPISEEQPTGPPLRGSGETSKDYLAVYDARKDARTAEKANLLAALGDDSGGAASTTTPDWKLVVRLASDVIATKSKDLWVAAWLVEGLTRVHGFAGVRDGFRVVRELCERYFDGIHPRPDDEDGITMTVSQLAGLNGEGSEGALIAPIGAIEITQGNSVGPFTGRDLADAENIARTADPDIRARRIAGGAPTLEIVEVAARETPPQFFVELREDITEAIAEFDKMNAVLNDKCGQDKNGYSAAPASSQISTALSEALSRVRSLAGEPAVEEDPSAEGEAAGAGGGASFTASGNITNREDAFKTLMKVAEYFRRAEPHSPVSYALEQAVRWGRMPLPELIRDLVSDDGVRREFFRRTGMKMDNDDN